MLRTEICDRLGIEYPILLAGMGGVSMHRLVAAVSNAGGLGVIGAATLDAEHLRREIRKTRELTDKPFAVDLLAPIPDMIRPQMQIVFDEGVKIFVAGLAVPQEFIAEMHARGMIVIVMIGKVRHAVKSEQAGADVVAAQGTEAGGHTGEIGGLALVPQVVDAVKIPVLAAGGIADGRGLVAALALGFVQGLVRPLDQCFHRLSILRELRNPHADRLAQQLVIGADGMHFHQLPEPIRNGHRLLRGELNQQEDELFPAVAADEIHFAQVAREQPGHIPEHHITDEMAEGVVLFLKPIQINHEQRTGEAMSRRTQELLLGQLEEVATDEYARQRIRHRERFHLLIELNPR